MTGLSLNIFQTNNNPQAQFMLDTNEINLKFI